LGEVTCLGKSATGWKIAHEDSLSQAEVDLSKQRLAIL